MELRIGDEFCISTLPVIMTGTQFEELLIGKSTNTTIPYMRHAKSLIVRGLLTRGTDRRQIGGDLEIIGGTFNTDKGYILGRIFLVKGNEKAKLLWEGPANEFRPAYMRVRDELAGKVPYRLYGRAARKREDTSEDKSLIKYEDKRPVKQGMYHEDGISEIPEIESGKVSASFLKPIEMNPLSNEINTIENGEYEQLVQEIKECSGGCLRSSNDARPMLRPPGGYRIPSQIMFILESPNENDDKYHGCLTIGPEDYTFGGPDPTAKRMMRLINKLGISYKDVYITNALLCLQPGGNIDWIRAFRPCLDRGWMKRTIELCNPRIIVTLGRLPLQAVVYALTGRDIGIVTMKKEVNEVRKIGEIAIYPLYHVGGRGCANRPEYEDDWEKVSATISV